MHRRLFLLSLLCVAFAGSTAAAADRARVLMIGDSLTVGPFGGSVESYLLSRYGKNAVAVYGSCGSSPEHWLKSEPYFNTKCGFRYATPRGAAVIDYYHGHRPPAVRTPKLEDLVDQLRPTVVIVQQGTNWMDNTRPGDERQRQEREEILERIAAALRGREVVWITPPDSSHFSSSVQRAVESQLLSFAGRHGYRTIVSSRMTHYIRGSTGGDGIHYNSEAGAEWARRVERELDHKL